jgi:membrane-associated phospholipid phosphatase
MWSTMCSRRRSTTAEHGADRTAMFNHFRRATPRQHLPPRPSSNGAWAGRAIGYGIAAYVSASRLHENVHNVSDVMFGSAVGVIAGRTQRNMAWELDAHAHACSAAPRSS